MTVAEYISDLAFVLATDGVESLQHAEIFLNDLQARPLTRDVAAEAAIHRAALISAQTFFAALPGLLEAADG